MVEPFNQLVISQMGLYYEEIRAGMKYFLEKKGRTMPCAIYHDTEYGHEIKEAAEDQAAKWGCSSPRCRRTSQPIRTSRPRCCG